MPPPPPPGGLYPTCGFIEERFNTLRNEALALNNAINEVKRTEASLIENLGTLNNALNSGVNSINGSVGGVSGKVDTVTTDVEDVMTKLGTDSEVVIDASLKQVSQDVSTAQTNILDKVDEVSTVTIPSAVTALQQDAQNRETSIKGEITSARNHVENDIRNALGLVRDNDEQANRKPIWPKIDDVETVANNAKTAAEANGGKLDDIYGELTAADTGVQAKLTGLDGDLNTAKGVIDDTNEKVTDIQNTLGVKERQSGTSLYQKVSDLSSTLGEKPQDGDSLYVKVGSIGQTVGQISDAVANLDTHTVSDNVSTLAETVGDLSETIGNRGSGSTLYEMVKDLAEKTDIQDDRIAELSTKIDTLTEFLSNLLTAIAVVPDQQDDSGDTSISF